MNYNNTYIPTQQLAEFVMKNEMAWQMRDFLIGFTCAEGNELLLKKKSMVMKITKCFQSWQMQRTVKL